MMEVLNWKDCEAVKIEKFPYKGKSYDVKGITVRWLSKCGEDDSGQPEYGLRLFTAEPGGEIPIHNHFYVQTMYIVTGRFECYAFEPDGQSPTEKRVCGPGDAIYIPSMEPHGMRNLSQSEPASFLCCICNVYEEEDL
jgi:quercetin dioxygenase-like cupin family protein